MAFVFLFLLPCALSNEEISWQNDNFDATEMKPRHLKEAPPPDLSKFKGVRITTDQSIVTLGKQEDIKLFRDKSGVLQIVAPKGVNFVSPAVKTGGKPIGSGGNGGDKGVDKAVSAELAAIRKLLDDVGISSNVERVGSLVCKKGWKGDRCEAACTNAGAHEFYSSVGCATTKCKAALKIGFRYTARTQHSLKKPSIDAGCKQVVCTNKNSRQVYIAGTTKLGGDKCNTKTCSTTTYISQNKCVPCPAGHKCDGTASKPKKIVIKDITPGDVNTICKTFGATKMTSSLFKNGKLLGFELVRRVAKGTKWHPQNDDLRGTAKYGTPPTNPTSGPTGTSQWNYGKVQYFMFSTGDYSEWMIIKRSMIDSKFGGPKGQQVLCSCDYNTPKTYNQYYRSSPEDPWMSYQHHGTSSMMYGENGYNGHSENVLKNGMNVWIYPPQ